MTTNDDLLLKDLRQLEGITADLPSVPEAVDEHGGLRVLALGSMMLGRELLQGVVCEARAHPPRALNAIRLARHLWELEHELHYVQEDPAPRLQQLTAREMMNRRNLRRDKVFRRSRAEQLAELTPEEREAAEDADREREKAESEEARILGQDEEDIKLRLAAGQSVEVNEYPRVPGRRKIAKAIGRGNEYTALYEAASLFAHPSILAIDNALTFEGGQVRPSWAVQAEALPGMAMSLARLSFARLARRAYEILGDKGRIVALDEFMAPRRIERTGVYENETP